MNKEILNEAADSFTQFANLHNQEGWTKETLEVAQGFSTLRANKAYSIAKKYEFLQGKKINCFEDLDSKGQSEVLRLYESTPLELDKIIQFLREGRVKIEKSKPETTYLEIKYVGYNERFEIELESLLKKYSYTLDTDNLEGSQRKIVFETNKEIDYEL